MEKLSIANRRLQAAQDGYERDYRAQIARLADEERDIRERLAELNRTMYDPSRADLDVADDDLVEINAGGTIVSARRSTLTQARGTRFEALFSGRWGKALQRDGRGRIFLDVNPVGFRAIVDYLNERAISSEENPAKPPCVDDEHEHILQHQLELFGLSDVVPTGLSEKAPAWEMTDSHIVKNAGCVGQLHAWLDEDDSDGELSLLYRSSRDGLTAAAFHSKCDDQGSTITIIETTCGYVLGGYSNAPWRSNGSYRAANKAFLFVLSGTDIMAPVKMKMKSEGDRQAVWHWFSYGPTFGGGHDLYVDALNSDVDVKFGHTYESGPSQLHNNGSVKTLNINEMEVFRVNGSSPSTGILTRRPKQRKRKIPQFKPVTIFSEAVNEAINAKQESIVQAEAELFCLKDAFKDEHNFISTFAGGHTKDVVVLNVSGAIMATKRSTLQAVDDSVLTQQFDDSKWTEQVYNGPSVRDWKPDDVRRWALSIDNVSSEVANVFAENEIKGNELLALDREGLRMLGIARVGTLCLLSKEIEKLERASCKTSESTSADAVALIQHSPYCFGTILDYLRLRELHSQGLAEAPALPQVRQGQRSRFEKVVRYYFPGNSAKLLLGRGE